MVLAAPDRDTAQWSADSLGRSEIEEVAEGYSYGANTIRDGVSLTPKRELRALALPSEIMRLENLHGYLKFPGPFPVASIRLKYVARPAAAERFVAREGDAAEAGVEPDGAANAEEASAEAPPEDEGMTIPDPAGEADAGPDEGSPAGNPAMDPALHQGELELLPLPGEAGAGETGARRGDAGKRSDKPKAHEAAAREGEEASGTASKETGDAPAIGDAAAPGRSEPGPASDDEPAEAGRTPEWI